MAGMRESFDKYHALVSKRIVDLVAAGHRVDPALWWRLAVFGALIAGESVLWRLGGFLGSRLIVDTGVVHRFHVEEAQER